jgi:site-specific recombinase XerD
VFFRWCVEEGEVEVSPMGALKAPKLLERPVDVPSEEDVRTLLEACRGQDFNSRRNDAIIRLPADSGLRRGELVGLQLEDNRPAGAL